MTQFCVLTAQKPHPAPVESTEPEITVEAAFPEDNPFGRALTQPCNQGYV
jgi:hypothetical protein